MVKIGSFTIEDFPLLLAPMEGVSDPSFRAICKSQGCDLMYTEFVSVEGIIRSVDKSMRKMTLFEKERPIGIQIFGSNLDSMQRAAKIVEQMQPELLDINFGCPVKKVVRRMEGAGILRDIDKMVELTDAIVRATSLPVTVKTRLGWDDDTIQINEVAERLQDVGIQALTIHGRTRKQMYKGEADWTLIGEIKKNPRIHIPIFGNGDIDSAVKAKLYKERYGVDGIMIGRAAIGNPWIFKEIKHYLSTGELLAPPSIRERFDMARHHLKLSTEWKGDNLGLREMRRHYTNYFKGLPNIKPFRLRLVTEYDLSTVYQILDEMESHYLNIFAVHE